jgi:hypothetical protein
MGFLFNNLDMKIMNKKIWVLLVVLMAASVSCKKILTVPPQGKLTFEQFWKSRDQAIAAIAGIYSNAGSTRWDFSTNGNLNAADMSPVEAYVYWGEMRGELLASAPGKLAADQITKENIDNFLTAPSDVTTKYTDFYRVINESNQAIKYIPGIVDLDPSLSKTEANQLVGEAYFLRAFAYFWLVRTFKEVPVILEASENDSQNYTIKKSSAKDIYAQIVKDLTIAKGTLPEWYSNTQYPRCRATKYTALTVLSDVELWMTATVTGSNNNALYDNVISNCDSIINSGRYLLVPGTAFGSIFSAGNTSESIFETYSNSLVNGQTNNLNNWFSNYFVVPGVADNLFSASIVADYRSALPPVGPVPQSGPVVSFNATTRVIPKFIISTNDARWEFYRLPDVLFMKAEALAHRYPDDIGQLQLACDLVNQVRARAYGIAAYPKITPSSTFDMDNALLDERGREFIGEGKRWFDLVRFASRDNFAHKDFLTQRVISSFSSVQQLIVTPRISNPDSWYLPLNSDALNSNPKLVQNPYYQ